MKIIKIIVIIFGLAVFLTVFQYINLLSLYRDQVEDAEIVVKFAKDWTVAEKNRYLSDVGVIEKEIMRQKHTVKVIFCVSFVGFVTFATIYYVKSKKMKPTSRV